MNHVKIAAGIVAIIVVVVIGTLIYRSNNNGSVSVKDNNPGQYESIDQGQMNPGTVPSATPTPKTTPSPTQSQGSSGGRMSYGEAINTYKNKIQFLACHGTPGTVAAAKGSPVLFDNRDQKSHVIKVGSQSITVAASDYAIFYPSTKGDFNVTCDGGGAATLKVD